MAAGVTEPWPKEHIPDDDLLYVRVLKDDIDEEGIPEPRVVRNHVDQRGIAAMSTAWSRYARPQDTLQRARRRPPADYGVISLNVGMVRRIPYHSVEHDPVFNEPEDPLKPNNRAHTNVSGPKSPKEPGGDVKIRALYIAVSRSCGWAIDPRAQ
ncbi:MAG TPA: hypothetical protein VH482_10210 [Thermomicrobiales bacterium]